MAKAKYSFFNLMTINIGSMVGAGILFKNAGILSKTSNQWIALVAWVIGGVLVYGITLAFAEASSATTMQDKSGTLANWAEMFVSKFAGLVTSNMYSWLWYPFVGVLLSYYGIYFSALALGFNYSTLNPVLFLGLVLMFWFCVGIGNALSIGFGKKVQGFGTFIKFIPLITAIVLGVVRPTVPFGQSALGGFPGGKPQVWNWTTIIPALPGIFFSFDAFLFGLSLSKEESKKGDAYKASLYSVIFAAILYLVITAVAGYGTDGTRWYDVFGGPQITKAMFAVMTFTVFITTNGVYIGGARHLKASYDSKTNVPLKSLDKIENDGRHFGQTMTMFATGVAYIVTMFVVAMLKQPAVLATKLAQDPKTTYTVLDEMFTIMDNYGNSVIVIGYAFYAIVVFGVYANRFKQKQNTDKQRWPHLWAFSAAVIGVVVFHDIFTKIVAGGTTSFMIIFALVAIVLSSSIAYKTQHTKIR